MFNRSEGLSKRRPTLVAAAAAIAGVMLSAIAADAGELRASITGARPAGGQVMVALFDGQEAFDAKRQVAGARLEADGNGRVEAIFTDLPVGRYMLAAFQDTDGDGALNRNLFGIPTEAYGFGGDPPSKFGPPRFDDAAVSVTETGRVEIATTLTP